MRTDQVNQRKLAQFAAALTLPIWTSFAIMSPVAAQSEPQNLWKQLEQQMREAMPPEAQCSETGDSNYFAAHCEYRSDMTLYYIDAQNMLVF